MQWQRLQIQSQQQQISFLPKPFARPPDDTNKEIINLFAERCDFSVPLQQLNQRNRTRITAGP